MNKQQKKFILKLAVIVLIPFMPFISYRLILFSPKHNEEIGSSTNQEEYRLFWREFPELFPPEKFYLGSEGSQIAIEDIIVEEELAKRARAQNFSLDQHTMDILRRFEKQWLAKAVFERDVKKSIKIKRKETRKFYELNQDKFSIPESVELYQIFVAAPEESTQEERKRAREKIEAAYSELKNRGRFEEVAEKYSEAESAKRGGYAGRLKRGIAPANIDTLAFKLKPGEISEIIETEHGFHIIKIKAHHPSRQQSLKEVASWIEQELRQQKEQQQSHTLLKKLSRRNWVKTHFAQARLPAPEELITSSTVLLRIGDEEFTYEDFKNRFNGKHLPQKLSQWQGLWPLVFKEELLAMEGRKQGFISAPLFLKKKHWVENYLLAETYFRNVIYPEITISAAEIREYYQKHRSSFIQPELAHCLVLTVRPPALPENPAARHYELRQLHKRLEAFLQSLTTVTEKVAPKRFEQEARKFADEMPGARFFDTGMIVPAERGRHFDMAVERLKPGELSNIVELPDGFMIILCLAKEPRRQLAFEEAQEKARRIIQQQKEISLRKALYLEILGSRAKSARFK